MRARKNEKEDEEFSYWDYFDKRTLLTMILIITLVCLIVGVIYIQLDFPSPEDEEPEPPYHFELPSGKPQNYTWGNLTYPMEGG